ncbi:MAG: Fic family protein [Candidatus Humimicrobiaceae bacterium]
MMFKPNYKYTNKIVNNLTIIAASRAAVLNAPLIPRWEVSLRREATLKSAHSSTAIEGNLLSFEEVSNLAAGRDIMVRRKDKQEVLNYLEALEKIPEFTKDHPLTAIDFLKIHKIVTDKTLENPEDEGVFRNREVYVGNRFTVVYRPPLTNEVPLLVDNFLNWFNSKEVDEIDSVIHAGISHYEIVRIHPFIDGNGRTARVMATLVLYKRGFDVKRFFTLDDYYDHNRNGYYEALKNVDQESLDLTGWLEYFTEGVAVSIKAVKDKVIGLSKDIKFLKERGQIALNERQMKIVEHLIQNNRVTATSVSKIFGISRQAALKEMNKLVDLEVIELEGKKKGAHYKLI